MSITQCEDQNNKIKKVQRNGRECDNKIPYWRIGQGPIGRFAPGSELARERKGCESSKGDYDGLCVNLNNDWTCMLQQHDGNDLYAAAT